MIQKTKLFIARMRFSLFVFRLEWEFWGKIAPQANDEKENGYPFHSTKELMVAGLREKIEAESILDFLKDQVLDMPRAYGDGFRYIMYRDLNKRLRSYAALAKRRVHPKFIDPRFVAQRAEV